jgi:hypothetical protein
MSNINNASVISEQYKDDQNLSIRIAFHQKYSTNKYGYTMKIVRIQGELLGFRNSLACL